ncbi:MAG: (E)-4-hydroxy-3-methylbut-2-enyl-diphosphate synthase [Chlamydiia bacterium]|nr:(E)-4-hydroxy-3-methylbut-2-enyl-diphosphate synthase [Chlamydiia bacterium]
MKYREAIHETIRRPTREVMVGPVGVGGSNPIRIQSMTTSNTRDVEATVEQVIRLADVGCEIARVTVQGMKEAEACDAIKNQLVQKGYTIPLVADIHFYPPAALRVAESVDKVRINPGNFVDKRASFRVIEYDDVTYAQELEKIEEKFAPLVLKCKALKRAMRIGTNHGSLSDRIMNRYGDTPQGMVESALEFARVCRKYDYHEFMFSMKASNPQVMIQAYRLLVAAMYDLDWDYPLHLGVTEAGEGEDGRIKSAMGIGSLLLDGLGDTIRVSLTEDPWYEIDPCQRLVRLAAEKRGIAPFTETHRPIDTIQKRPTEFSKQIAMHTQGTVILTVDNPNDLVGLGCPEGKLKRDTVDVVCVDKPVPRLQEMGIGVLSRAPLEGALQLMTLSEAKQRLAGPFALEIGNEDPEEIAALKPTLLIFAPTDNFLHRGRRLFESLQKTGNTVPVIFRYRFSGSKEDLIIAAAAEMGALFCDGFGNGIWLEADLPLATLRTLSFNILQSARMRSSKTEFISCPSCGRTLFNLQEVTKRIHARTAHLPGVKIAIMGCIVNGPGEMADADFGYVGSRPGKIDLYVGKECVEKNIDFADADDRLVALLKTHGRWQDPE